MKYLFVCSFVTVYLCGSLSLGYTGTSPLYTHLTYMFQHAGIGHLLLNSLAFASMFGTLEKLTDKRAVALAATACAFAASFFSTYALPTVGASAMIYSMTGLFFGMTAFCRHIKIADIRKFRLFILTVGISLIVSYFKLQSNFTLHIVSLAAGFIVSPLFAIRPKRK